MAGRNSPPPGALGRHGDVAQPGRAALRVGFKRAYDRSRLLGTAEVVLSVVAGAALVVPPISRLLVKLPTLVTEDRNGVSSASGADDDGVRSPTFHPTARADLLLGGNTNMIIGRTPHHSVLEVRDVLGTFLGRYDLAWSSVVPRRGSPCDLEEQQLPPSSRVGANSSILVHADMAIQLRLLVATDCMKGIVSLVEPGTSIYSVFPMARTAMEAFAYAAWLLEPEINPALRAYRGAQEHKESAKRSLRNLNRYTAIEPLSDEWETNLHEAIASIEANLICSKQDLAIAHGLLGGSQHPSYPSPSRVVNYVSDNRLASDRREAGAYSHLSGMVHSSLAGLLVEDPFDEHDGHLTIKVNRYLLPIATATRFMELSLTGLADYWGLPSSEGEAQRIFEMIKEHYYQYGEEYAFS